MKNITLFIGLFIFVSCSESKEEHLISDYEQTKGNTKTNLNLKFKKVDFVKDITSKDSFDFYIKRFIKEKEEVVKQSDNSIEEYEQNIKDLKKIDGWNKNIGLLNMLETYENTITLSHKRKELFRGDCKGTYLEEKYSIIKKFENNLDSILSKEYDVIFTIKNPSLNNVEQTISKKYYFNPEISKIIKVVNISI